MCRNDLVSRSTSHWQHPRWVAMRATRDHMCQDSRANSSVNLYFNTLIFVLILKRGWVGAGQSGGKGTFLEEIWALFTGTKIHVFWRYMYGYRRHICARYLVLARNILQGLGRRAVYFFWYRWRNWKDMFLRDWYQNSNDLHHKCQDMA